MASWYNERVGAEISSTEIGSVYECAVRNGKIDIPLAGPEE